mmetsp:Transcript_62797/g.144623  ORF Transcript_62797/g.144623 Transcript_62797/m.144623 type:complete len:396 (+) Transcript_62797:78-1265(+)
MSQAGRPSRMTAIAASVVANSLSLCACIWLDRKIGSMPEAVRQRLFPRQMRNLARADMLISATLLVFSVVNNPAIHLDQTAGLVLCWIFGPTMYFGRVLSACCEVQIALGIAIVWYRRLDLVPMMIRTSWVMPVASAALTVVAYYFYPYTGYTKQRCYMAKVHSDIITAAWMSLANGLTVVLYCATLVKAFNAPSSARNGVLLTTMLYPINFIWTSFPLLLVEFDLRLGNTDFFDVALVAEGLNGLLNVLTYFVQSRYARRLAAGRSMPAGNQKPVSFHVVFDPDGADVVEVSFYGQAPHVRSEIEIANLEVAREPKDEEDSFRESRARSQERLSAIRAHQDTILDAYYSADAPPGERADFRLSFVVCVVLTVLVALSVWGCGSLWNLYSETGDD